MVLTNFPKSRRLAKLARFAWRALPYRPRLIQVREIRQQTYERRHRGSGCAHAGQTAFHQLPGGCHRLAYPPAGAALPVLWLPGILSLPALDRDESRFAQSSRQMLDSGNYVDIRFGQVPRYKKPVGIYWLQAATTAIAGHVENLATASDSHIWTYRLPSLLGGIAAVWLTFWCGSVVRRRGGLAGRRCCWASACCSPPKPPSPPPMRCCWPPSSACRACCCESIAPPRRARPSPPGWCWRAGRPCAVGILVKGPVIAGRRRRHHRRAAGLGLAGSRDRHLAGLAQGHQAACGRGC